MLRYLTLIPVINNITDSFIDNVLRPKVKPVEGSIVYCDLLLGYAEHSGIYIGNDQIVHKNRHGIIESVSSKDFIENTTAISIYVSSYKGNASGSVVSAWRAESQIGIHDEYSFYRYNCHQFCSYCISGDLDNYDISLMQLKTNSKNNIDIDDWLVWDR
ncbi:TPA: lecithin retinol acyltransferase family protein [Photobacterium damselae]